VFYFLFAFGGYDCFHELLLFVTSSSLLEVNLVLHRFVMGVLISPLGFFTHAPLYTYSFGRLIYIFKKNYSYFVK